ncbi:MAG: helix-turn-helix domain-containing protein [Christensenellaceae bacterium]|nr:helix-turn-helix domain-containing protein [Christensenellaceae bacterium]
MGRKKFEMCQIRFDDNKTLDEKILSMFSTENLLNCFSDEHVDEYQKIFDDPRVKTLLHDEDLMQTIKILFERGFNKISTVSNQAYIHRNTMLYRIQKIKTLIGLDVRNFDHAMAIKNLLVIRDRVY